MFRGLIGTYADFYHSPYLRVSKSRNQAPTTFRPGNNSADSDGSNVVRVNATCDWAKCVGRIQMYLGISGGVNEGES